MENLSARVYPSLNWGPGECEASLRAVFQSAQLQALEASKWYVEHARPQKRWARLFRSGALVLAGIAGLLPIVSQILLTRYPSGDFALSPAWASVALALAAGLIGFDRFFGFSNSWLRYCTTDCRLRELLRAFQLDWQIANEGRRFASAQSQEQLIALMLKRARAFEMDLQALIRQETEEWRQEFQGTLKQIDETAGGHKPSRMEREPQSKPEAPAPGKMVIRRAAPRPPPPPRPRAPVPPRAREAHRTSASAPRAEAVLPATDDTGTEPLAH